MEIDFLINNRFLLCHEFISRNGAEFHWDNESARISEKVWDSREQVGKS